MRPSEARIEVNDDANVDDLSNVDCLFRWRRPDVVSEIAILLHPAERLSTSHVILATAEEHDILLPDRQCDRTVCMIVVTQVTSLVVTEIRSASTRGVPWRVLLLCCGAMYWWVTYVENAIFFIVECGIARYVCAMRILDVLASFSSHGLPLCQISFPRRPSLLS